MKLLRSLPVFLLPCCLAAPAPAQTTTPLTATVLYQGGSGTDPHSIERALTRGTDGNFYGVSREGGTRNDGTVIKMTPSGTLTVLYSFANDSIGYSPSSNLLLASDGNFYGTNRNGGLYGKGTLFRVTADGMVTVIYQFPGSPGGALPQGDLIQGSDGYLYGTTQQGGASTSGSTTGYGTAYKITRDGAPVFVASFNPDTNLGDSPLDGMIQANDGNFYGSTASGHHLDVDANGNGALSGIGNIFKLTPDGVLSDLVGFSLPAKEPRHPNRIIQGADGALYGSSTLGGANNYGTVFKVDLAGHKTIIHSFSRGDAHDGDGNQPRSALLLAQDGNLYGTTSAGSTGVTDSGVIYKVTPNGAYSAVYAYVAGTGGSQSELIQGTDGNLYGTSYNVLYRVNLVPVSTTHPAFFNGEVALGQGVYYLAFPGNGNIFGYYQYLSDPKFVYHFDLGFEYVFDLGNGGVVFYDFKSNDYFYTSPSFAFPYLYDFGLNAFLYYYPDPTNPQRYNTNGVRYFFNFNTGKVISK